LHTQRFERPTDFDLAEYWQTWSGAFEASRPRLAVVVHATPAALRAFPEVFGDAVRPALAAAKDTGDGRRAVALTFEHERAAATRLAGFGADIEVVSPRAVRKRIVANARATLRRHAVS
jgi:predicted DNA-binding transcriptional regulator YafY